MKNKSIKKSSGFLSRLLLLTAAVFFYVTGFSQQPKLTKATSSPVQLKMNKRFYNAGETVSASLILKPGTTMIHPFIILVSPRTGDAEGVKLKSGANGNYETESAVKLDPSASKGKNDGVLAIQPGEVIIAYYYNTDQKNKNTQNKNAQPDIVCEFAFVRGNENYRANLLTNKGLALQQNEAAENAATVLVEGQVPVQIASNQLIFYSNNDQQWKDFLQYSNCKLISTIPGGNAKTGSTYLIEVPVKEQNLNDLGQLRQFLGYKQKIVSSNEETIKLLQFCALANLDGYAVSLNPRLQFNSADTKTTLDYFSNPGSADNMPTSFQQSLTNIPKVWNYMAIWDRDNVRVNVAILDMGFNTNQDFRNASTMRECVADATSVRCSPGAAQGIPTVGNSLFGGRSWHGNGVVARIGGQLNDGFGTAGTGGQVVVPMLIKMSGIETYAFNIGGAIRSAVNSGANVINISAGFPCRALTSIGDFTYCEPGVRGAICAALFPIVQTGAIIACSALAWIPFATEICIAIATSAYISACVAQLAIGNPGEVMNDAVQFAKSRGVPVVASAGNIISPADLSTIPAELRSLVNLDINRQTVEEWNVVPAGLADVICVGASHPSARAGDILGNLNFPPFIAFGNNQTFGSRVDIWAPEDGKFMAPEFADRLPAPGEIPILHGSFNGTSASAPFITGLVANVMAVNPQLNRSTSSSITTIVRDIRNLLTTTAWRPGTSFLPTDSRRRNVVNPIEFIKAAGLAPGSPIPAFSESVYGDGWNMTSTENRDDEAATATLMIYSREGVSRNGAIVFIPGSGTAPAITDIDRYHINILSSYVPSSGEKVLIKLRTPTGSRFGNLTVRGTGLTLLRTDVIGSNEEEKVFEGPLVRSGMTVDFSVEGTTPDQDNIYFVAVGNATASTVGPARSVTLTDITGELCPTTLVSGDREFGGGPLININARLERTADESGIDVIITYRAEETGGDRTTATGEFRQRVFTAAAGNRIVSVSPSTASSSVVNFRAAGAGAEFGICNEGVVQEAPVTGGLIRRIVVVGDSGGNDVSAGGGCRCDTKIKSINFNPVMITTAPR